MSLWDEARALSLEAGLRVGGVCGLGCGKGNGEGIHGTQDTVSKSRYFQPYPVQQDKTQ